VARGAVRLSEGEGARLREGAPLVGVVVVNWRRRDVTLECLAALARLDYPSRRLFLVDNGCSDFSADEVAASLPGGAYLSSEANLGFAGGSNLGMRAALADGAAFVWFLNNDAAPEPAALAELVAVAEATPALSIVGAKILRKDDPRRIDSAALAVDLRTGRMLLVGHDEEDRGQYDALSRVDAVTGCAMLVRREACERLGGFDESFFSYLEDADLCLRARRAGFGVAFAPRARVLHDRPAASRGRQSVASLYYTTRNHLLLMRRHGAGLRWPRLRAAAVLALNVAYAARPGAGTARERLGAVWRGALDYRRGAGGASFEVAPSRSDR
jgi:GT2 family glycosyltransferase